MIPPPPGFLEDPVFIPRKPRRRGPYVWPTFDQLRAARKALKQARKLERQRRKANR